MRAGLEEAVWRTVFPGAERIKKRRNNRMRSRIVLQFAIGTFMLQIFLVNHGETKPWSN